MEPYIGQIILFANNYAVQLFAFCHGQSMPISQHTSLFAVIGTNFGGDGRSTFDLPDLRGRTPIGFGQAPGLVNWVFAGFGGLDVIQMSESQMPSHTHVMVGARRGGPSDSPKANLPALIATGYSDDISNLHPMDGSMIGATGAGAAFDNRQPYLGLHFQISLDGAFPSRN